MACLCISELLAAQELRPKSDNASGSVFEEGISRSLLLLPSIPSSADYCWRAIRAGGWCPDCVLLPNEVVQKLNEVLRHYSPPLCSRNLPLPVSYR